MIGAALAHVWRDPLRQPTAAESISPADLAPLHDAWSLTAAGYDDLKLDELSLGELTPDRASVEPLIRWLSSAPQDRIAALDAVFGLVTSKDCPPHETDYCHWDDPTYRSSQMADVGGFYRAFGVQPGGERPERADHVSVEIEFVAFLYQKIALAIESGDEQHISVGQAAFEAFIRDHVTWWMPTFARCVQRRIERIHEPAESTPLATGLLAALDGISDLLRAWVAIARLDAGLPVSREIIAPSLSILRPEEEESCGECETSSPCAASLADRPTPPGQPMRSDLS